MINPLIPMCAITGRPQKNEIFDYLKSLKDNSIEQILLYPRSGCEVEYLSNEWFDTIEAYLEVAQTLGMYVWLYDEYNWPSGNAGGRVTKNPKYRLKSISYKGESIGRINTSPTLKGSLFEEKYFPDLLSDEAVDYFMNITHEKYFEKFKRFFSKTIKGIFTDEPSIAYCCDDTSLPYYEGMENDYVCAFSRDFFEDLKNEYDSLSKNVLHLAGERFNKCYTKKLRLWCDAHGIFMTGHLMRDDTPYGATISSGDFLKNLKTFSLPGVDELITSFKSASLFSLLGATEFASGEHGGMAELFALGPCDISYAKRRCMIFLAACFKINHYFLAVSHMDMRGNTKIKDYFNDFSTTQPDFCGMKLFSKEAKKAALIAKKDFVPDVYIKYPKDICALKYGENINMKPFCDIINILTEKQVQWKYTEKDSLHTPTIDFTEDFKYIYKGEIFETPDELVEKINLPLIITDIDGNAPKELFIRHFNDSTTLVINLSANQQTIIFGEDKHVIYPYGTLILNETEQTYKRERFCIKFDIKYSNANISRAMFVNNENIFEINCEEKCEIVLAIRHNAHASINGQEIQISNSKAFLPRGIKDLYNLSFPIILNKGKNILSSSNDYKYLPSVLLVGDFSSKIHSDNVCAINLVDRKTSYIPKEKLEDFGELTFSSSLFIPHCVKGIEILGTPLYTSLYLDGNFIGESIYSPHRFEFEEMYCGKQTEIKIVQRSSISPIFGDVQYFDKHHKDVSWRSTPSSSPCEFGFDEISFLFEEEL